MKYISLSNVFLCALVAGVTPIHAVPFYEGTSQHEIIKHSANEKFHRALGKINSLNALSKKSVTVLNVNLNATVKKNIQNKLKLKNTPSFRLNNYSSSLPSHKQLGMNGVPVLDQGAHGTCATFAVIGAIDAIKGKGDYYSQLCPLNLGKTLAENGYNLSGWNGQTGTALLARIEEFGLVTKEQQHAVGCGGLTEYPRSNSDDSLPMTLEAFHKISKPSYFSGLSQSSILLDFTQWMTKEQPDDALLYKVKKSLYYGNRIVIGTLLPITDDLGASGSHQTQNDTWLLSGALEQAIKMFSFERDSDWGGHAMIITGYDDNAVVTDKEGNPHKGIFTLRNSWGSDAGDKGNYYMSYDYLTVLAMELIELINVSNKK